MQPKARSGRRKACDVCRRWRRFRPKTAEKHRRRSIGFLNWGHFLDHYVILIFPTVVIGLEAVYRRSYGDLLMLSTAAFTAFGMFALPFGWLADHWSRRNMMAIYFLGTGVSCVAVGLAPDFFTLAIALFARRRVRSDLSPGRHSDGDRYRDQPRPHHGAATACAETSAYRLPPASPPGSPSRIGWRSAFFVPAALFRRDRHRLSASLVPDDRSAMPPR